MFKQKEVMKFDGAIISRELLEEIHYCDYVYAIDHNGYSGTYTNCYWFTIEFRNGKQIDVYVKESEYNV